MIFASFADSVLTPFRWYTIARWANRPDKAFPIPVLGWHDLYTLKRLGAIK